MDISYKLGQQVETQECSVWGRMHIAPQDFDFQRKVLRIQEDYIPHMERRKADC